MQDLNDKAQTDCQSLIRFGYEVKDLAFLGMLL